MTHGQPAVITGTWTSFRNSFEVFYRPGECFDELREDPRILAPYALFCALIFLSALLVVRLQTFAELNLITSRGVDMSSFPVGQLVGLLFIQKSLAIFSPLVVMSVAGLLLWLGDRKVPSKRLFAVIIHGELIYAAGCLLTSLLILATNNAYASFSLAPLLNDDVSSGGYRFLSKFDCFLIWEIVVIGAGLNRILQATDRSGYKLAVVAVGVPSALVALMF